LVWPQSFQHLWKNLWKMLENWPRVRQKARFYDSFVRRKAVDHGLKPFSIDPSGLHGLLRGGREAKLLKFL